MIKKIGKLGKQMKLFLNWQSQGCSVFSNSVSIILKSIVIATARNHTIVELSPVVFSSHSKVHIFLSVFLLKGDIIGCYIEYFDSVKCVQFIKNGQLVGTAQVKGSDTDLYPSVGFAGNPTTVRLKWQHTKPQLPPVYSQVNILPSPPPSSLFPHKSICIVTHSAYKYLSNNTIIY